ncbi:MAG: transposase, partial [Paludibacter sp.]
MYRKSVDHKQLNAFSSPIEYLKDSTMNYYLKNDSWHNQFRKQVVMRVDESIFSVLYTELTGAPNASIRVLVGMMILKEAHGWSDEQLFENCNFNLLTRSALGLMTLEDAVPVASTYYLFRRNLVMYAKEHGVDLSKKCQEQITASHLYLDQQDNNKLIVTDNKTVNQIQAQQVNTRKDPTQKKWKIKTEEGNYRYFDRESIRAAALR